MVGTTRKSTETICAEWFFRNVFQRCLVVLGSFFGMYRSTEDSEISNPSFNSSPWIRGAPQRGLSLAICLIKLIWARGIAGRPGVDLLFHFPNTLKLCWCQRMTVSGLKTRSVSFQELKTSVMTLKKILSEGRSRGLEDVRASISSCFRRKMISS